MNIELLNRMHQCFHIASVNGLPLPNDWIQLAPYLHQKGFKRIEALPEERMMALISWYEQQISDATESVFGKGDPDKISVTAHRGTTDG